MISTALIGTEAEGESINMLSSLLTRYFPQLNVRVNLNTPDQITSFLCQAGTDLLFIDSELKLNSKIDFLEVDSLISYETIYTTKVSNHSIEDINHCPGSYLLLPINLEQFIFCVNKALDRIREKNELLSYKKFIEHYRKSPGEEMIGVPTIEGVEFIPIKNIIRCEGLRRYTSVVAAGKPDIISSYNIGEFVKMLEPYSFFSPHKSHLINLAYVKTYYKEGSIILTDGSRVPVSKRRKCKFLNCIKHL